MYKLLDAIVTVVIPATFGNAEGCTPIQWKVASLCQLTNVGIFVMESFILVFSGYAKIVVSFKCDHYAANTYSGDSYVKNNHEEEILEIFMSKIIISLDVLQGIALYRACHWIYEHCFEIE